jgi:hypothetical protein
MLPFSLDCPFLITPPVFSGLLDNPEKTGGVIKNGQSRENRRGNQEWTIQRKWQHWVYKTQDEDKPIKHNTMTLAPNRDNSISTFGTQRKRYILHMYCIIYVTLYLIDK